MATYRFRVRFEDHEDVVRDIEARSTQTFEDLHFAIHNAIGFDASKSASFFLSDDNWKKGKEFSTDDSSGTIPVRSARLCDYIADPHQKIYYIFDPATNWTFRIELIKISRDEDMGANYPRCVKSSGEAPRQYHTPSISAVPVPEDFDLDADEDIETEEAEETPALEVDVDDLPEGEEKETFLKDEESQDEDFETAGEEGFEDESSEKDDF